MKVHKEINDLAQDYITACLQAGMTNEAKAWNEALIRFNETLRENWGYNYDREHEQ